MEKCKFKVGDRITNSAWASHPGHCISKIEGDKFWFEGYPYEYYFDNSWIIVEEKKSPHKHAELAKKWFDDPSIEIELAYPGTQNPEWYPSTNPKWDEDLLYRIKPTPKSDVVVDKVAFLCGYVYTSEPKAGEIPNVRFIFDGETNELKSVEMI